MTMDAKLEIKSILINNWDSTATSYGQVPPIRSGWFERETNHPAIAVTSKDEGPTGGDTGFYAMSGAGNGGVQKISGTVTIDCVAGTANELRGAGPNGEDLNPKQLREEMHQHAAQILVNQQTNTDLLFVSPGESQEIEEQTSSSDPGDVLYRTQLRAKYQYERRPQ